MRIGLDISAVRHGLTNGVAVYTANLARALLRLPEPPELVVWYCARESAPAGRLLEELASVGAEVERAPAPWRWSPDGAWWLPIRPPLTGLLDRVDAFHVGEFQLPPAPRPDGPAYVATVHDLTTLTHPRHHTVLNRLVHRRRLAWIRRHARRVIAVSGSTARDLSDAGVDRGRIDVVHEARGHDVEPADLREVRDRYGIEGPYILTVGTLEPRKNHVRLIRAFEALDHRDIELVLVGGDGWRSGAPKRAIRASRARARIRRLGAVPDADLAALYAGATVFAYPSLYEGFGLPVLEAMAAGTPVLTSDVSSLPEVAGDAALLVDPGSADAIRSGLDRLLHDPGLRDRLAERGRAREREFSWERTAQETLTVYRTILNRTERRQR